MLVLAVAITMYSPVLGQGSLQFGFGVNIGWVWSSSQGCYVYPPPPPPPPIAHQHTYPIYANYYAWCWNGYYYVWQKPIIGYGQYTCYDQHYYYR